MTLWDATQPKLGLRITPAGAKSFIMLAGSGRRQVIGRYPEMSLKDARSVAGRRLAEKALGKHSAPAITVTDAYAVYATTHCDQKLKLSTAKETKRLLKSYLLPKVGSRPIADVAKPDITTIVDGLLSKPGEARHAFATIRAFFGWAVRRGFLEGSPCDRLQSPTKAVARERVLSLDELSKVVLQARRTGYPFGTIVLLLIFTGQRRGEIAALRWDWIDEENRTITLPASLTKNKRAHTFPYGPTTADLLASLPRRNEFVFPALRDRRKDQPATIFAGWGKPKADFDKLCPLPPWTLHDLRRTYATNLAALGVRMEVTEKLLNHVSGSFGGIVGVYQRHEFRDEMRAAIDMWERRVAAIDLAQRRAAESGD